MTEATTEATGGRGRRSAGVVMIQAVNSLSTVVQMVIFAILLPRSTFDDYAVWATSAQFLVGIGQAIGSDRVVIGRRTRAQGVHSAKLLAVVLALAQMAVAVALGSLPLMVCGVSALAFVYYDYQRMVRCFDEPAFFLRRDLILIAVQVGVVLAAAAFIGRSEWLVLGWWVVGLPLWIVFSGGLAGRFSTGWQVLRRDMAESLPLLVDAILAGVPMVIALALAHAQGGEGVASAARMALTILGPVTVVALAGRRLVYAQVAAGPLSPTFAVRWAGVVTGSFLLCVALLTLTLTPLYPWVFTGFEALSWFAIIGYAVNHSAVIATFLPAARLRASGRARAVGVARIVAASVSGLAGLWLAPFDSPGDVGWCVGAGSVAYAVSLFAADLFSRGAPATPVSSPVV